MHVRKFSTAIDILSLHMDFHLSPADEGQSFQVYLFHMLPLSG